MDKLTKRQEEVLTFISRFVATHGYPPTRSEICSEFGWASANAAEDHIVALAKKGRLFVTHGVARGLRVA